MTLQQFKAKIPQQIYELLLKKGFTSLRPCQEKAIDAGLFEQKNLLICTPTASGKTLVGELSALNAHYEQEGKAIYVVPLRALASEKYRQFKKEYPQLKISKASGDIDSPDTYLAHSDIIVTTSEKLDSLLRHRAPWISQVRAVIIDEIHLLNDPGRGPTLEIVIAILRQLLPQMQLIGLSATIGNPEELAKWLEAELVIDTWRPVKLKKGILQDHQITFYE